MPLMCDLHLEGCEGEAEVAIAAQNPRDNIYACWSCERRYVRPSGVPAVRSSDDYCENQAAGAAPEKLKDAPVQRFVWSYRCVCGEDVMLLSLDDWTECSCGAPLDRSRLQRSEVANITSERV